MLLDLASLIFEEQQSLEVILKKIAATIISFMQVQRCTIFIVDEDCPVSMFILSEGRGVYSLGVGWASLHSHMFCYLFVLSFLSWHLLRLGVDMSFGFYVIKRIFVLA